MSTSNKSSILILITGDFAALLIVTMIGFASHAQDLDELRWLTTFLPLCISWLILAPWFGSFQGSVHKVPFATWRPALAMLIATPLAALFRSIWLQTNIIPSFVIVLGITSSLGVSVWRLLWAFSVSRSSSHG